VIPVRAILRPWRFKLAWALQLEAWAEQLRRRAAAGKVPIVGRNDPCPCGSRRKFKFCHGR